MKKVCCVLAAVLAMSASTFASTMNIFGRVTDTLTGVPLDNIIVTLAKQKATVDTTGADGMFFLNGPITLVHNGILPESPLIKCSGANVHLLLRQPMHLSLEVFNTSGKRLAKPLDKQGTTGDSAIMLVIGLFDHHASSDKTHSYWRGFQ